MVMLNELIETQIEEIRKGNDKELKYKDIILGEIERNEEGVPLDMQIEATLQQLEKVKQRFRYIKTKQLFLQRIVTSKSVEQLFPPSNEMAQLEMSLGAEKQKLRSIKATRREAEKRLATAAEGLGKAIEEKESRQEEAKGMIRKAKSVVGMEKVKDVIECGDDSRLEDVVRNVEELDEKSCKMIIKELRTRRRGIEEEDAEQTEKHEALSGEVAGLRKKIGDLETENRRLKRRISESDKENGGHAEVRKECEMQEQYGEMLYALSGVKVLQVRNNGMTFGIKDHIFRSSGRKGDASGTEYKLDVEFGRDGKGRNVVGFMHIEPSVVRVSDIREEHGMSLEQGVQEVCSRLAQFVREKEQL